MADTKTNGYWPTVAQAVFGGPRPAPATAGPDSFASRYAVTDFACATIGAAGQALADLTGGDVTVDRRLASLWFQYSAQPVGWQLPGIWDAIAGVYAASDGWIRLHTNAPHHRAAALSVLGCAPDREAVARAVAVWRADDLEAAIVAAQGAAARLRSRADWAAHPQGRAVAAEPLVLWEDHAAVPPWPFAPRGDAPLAGLRVLDLTRVLAGPVATRFLAGFGADVLRVDPPGWDEPAVLPDVTLGKRCATLDLSDSAGRELFEGLLREADVLVHGYRPGALEALGFGAAARRALSPGLIDVSLCAYGHSGPWAARRGFDSLVQMSSGIAAPMAGDGPPHPLPVQALDHGTGYLMAACVLVALRERAAGRVRSARLSLARTGEALARVPGDHDAPPLVACDEEWQTEVEASGWGALRRLRPPLSVGVAAPDWLLPAGPLHRDAAVWT